MSLPYVQRKDLQDIDMYFLKRQGIKLGAQYQKYFMYVCICLCVCIHTHMYMYMYIEYA